MLIASYNPTQMGDVLLTMVRPEAAAQATEQKGRIVRIFNAENNETLGFNFFDVAELTEHPDSDHLHIAKIEVDNDQTLQIVCGAPNIEAGQNVVVAKVGAMMPNGAMIWPGKLRGVDSYGMVCAARELELPNAPKKRGILVLDPAEFAARTAFDFEKGAKLFTA